jgi:DNA gyrase subunit A
MRIVIELSRDGQAASVLNQLYKHTAMQSSFAVNMVSLDQGQPKTMGLKKMLEAYIDHRRIVLRRRTEFELERARDREHILLGYLIALKDIDKIIALIRGAASAEDAKNKMMAKPWSMSDRQAQAVLDLQLRRLAKLERDKIEDEYKELIKRINYLEDLLANPRKIDFLIKDEAEEVKKKYADERRTQVVEQEVEDFSEEDLIPHQECAITLTNRGYIKRLPLETYRTQHRGGRGITGMGVRETDAIYRLLVADTHDSLLFFTDRGRVFQLKVHEIPDSSRQARGTPLVNLIEIEPGELVTATVGTTTYDQDFMLLATKLGEIKKTPLREFESVRRAGLIAMDIEEGDSLVLARLAREGDDVVLVSLQGKAIRFTVAELRSASRQSGGVRGMRLTANDDEVVAMEIPREGAMLLTISETGLGKRTEFAEYPRHSRGGQGVLTHNVTARTGKIVAARTVVPGWELILVSQSGIVMRTTVDSIAKVGRATQGVHVMNVGQGDRVASLACIDLAKNSGNPGANGNGARANGGSTDAPAAPRRRNRRSGS